MHKRAGKPPCKHKQKARAGPIHFNCISDVISVLVMRRRCAGDAPAMLWLVFWFAHIGAGDLSGDLLAICWQFAGDVLAMCWRCAGDVRAALAMGLRPSEAALRILRKKRKRKKQRQ